jgi:hypothetical protein
MHASKLQVKNHFTLSGYEGHIAQQVSQSRIPTGSGNNPNVSKQGWMSVHYAYGIVPHFPEDTNF